jgi:hypothetical protein
MRGQRQDDRLQRVLVFRQCPLCSYDISTGEGERGCHYGDCPGLPEELDLRCPTCYYNVLTDDIVPACGDPPTCTWAVEEAPRRLELLAAWLEHQGT